MSRREMASTFYEVRKDNGTYFSYTKPRVGSKFTSFRSRSGVRYKDVGAIHSHANFNDPSDQYFSEGDIKTMSKHSDWAFYLTTPTGLLLKYGVNEPVYSALPSDDEAGDLRKNYVDASIGPKNEPTFGLSDWIGLLYPGTGWRGLK